MNKYFFSESAYGFYSSNLHSKIPDDSVEISLTQYQALLFAVSNGEKIVVNENGEVVALNAKVSITTESIKEAVTQKRWQIETGGLSLQNGVHIATGIDDQNRITSVIANAELAGVESVDFKAASGWVSVSVADLKALAAAIALHVQRCFTAERAHHEAIDALSAQHAEDEQALQAALQAYDIEQGWPASDYANEVNNE